MKICPHLLANLHVLSAHKHPIYPWLSQQSTSAEALNSRIFINRWGMIDWRMDNGSGLFDNIPPRGLYHPWTKMKKPETSASIIVGSNLGYGITTVLQNTPDTHKVLVVEPDPNMLAACLGQTDFRPFIEAKKIHFCIPTKEYLTAIIQQMDLQFIFGSILVRSDTPSTQIGPEYARMTQLVRGLMENFTVELTTLRHKQDTMVQHELANFERSLQDGSLKRLEGCGEGVSAVILGAGPSLAEQAPLLKENRGNALYATSMQTLPVLQRYDFKPDFCLAIDYSEGMLNLYRQLDLEWVRDIPLIYSTKLDPRVVERYPGPTLPLWTVGGMATYVMRGRDFVLDAGGNVSLSLLRFLTWCNVKQITLVGQDFAWKGDHSHAEGHHAHAAKQAFNPKRHQRIKNLEGEEIVTTMQYQAAKRDIEADIKKTPFSVFNLYGGYSPILGAENVKLDQAGELGVFRSDPGAKEAFMEALAYARRPTPRPVFESRRSSWAKSMRNVEKKLEKLFRKCNRNQDEIHKIFNRTLLFVKQDQLYAPYLYNEIVDMSGLARVRSYYEPKDFAAFKQIAKRIVSKVREVDQVFSEEHKAA
ncbi:MAG: motility associated factor glycosyltransferase family protein [Desulfovibrionaceae bacterium]